MTNEFEGYLAVTSLIIELEQKLKVFWTSGEQGFTKQASKLIKKMCARCYLQRRAEARLGLFYSIVHKSVDIDATIATTLMTRSTRPTRKANEVQYTRHMTSKDCYKYSFIPRTIIQWYGIAAPDDFNQYKSGLKSHVLTLSGASCNY